MKYLSLFSGIGGFEYGIQRVCIENQRQSSVSSLGNTQGQSNEQSNDGSEGFTCIGYSEIDKYARRVYERHYPRHPWLGDITKLETKDIPDFDLLVGGFPCQAFSISGKRGGFSDTRGTLFFEIARILKDKRPRYFLLENVKGLLSHESGKTFQTILKVLSGVGYVLQWEVLNSKNFGVPQNRERVFIVGHLRGERRPEVFPIGETNKVHNGETANCLDANYHKGWLTHGQRTMILRDGRDNRSCLRPGRKLELRYPGLSIRRLTPTECERLQGFPDGLTEGISDTQRYKCLGNAVTTTVIECIVRKLCTHI